MRRRREQAHAVGIVTCDDQVLARADGPASSTPARGGGIESTARGAWKAVSMTASRGSAIRGDLPARSGRLAGRGRETSFPRPLLLAICTLALATALSLLVVATVVIDRPASLPAPADAPAPADTVATDLVRSFYAAVNDVLLTGDPAGLADIVAPDLVEHPGLPDADGAAGLIQALLAQRTTWPGVRLVVDDVRATGPDAVTAWVHAEATGSAAIPGFTAAVLPVSWGPLEVLRIADGRIAERWASHRDPVLVEPLGYLPANTDAKAMVLVERHTIQSGAVDELIAGTGHRWLYVESGTVNVAVRQSSSGTWIGAIHAEPVTTALTAGSALEVTVDLIAAITTTEPVPALVLVATALLPETERVLPFTRPVSGVAVVSLALLQGALGEPFTLSRVTLEAGAVLSRGVDAGPAGILVESGGLSLVPAGTDGFQIVTAEGHLRVRSTEQALLPGELVQLPAGWAGTVQAGTAETVSLLVLTT